MRQIWVTPKGDLWLASDEGIHAYDDGAWTPIYAGDPALLLGADAGARVWALVDGGEAIAACDLRAGCPEWTRYGPEAGWEALPYADYLSPGYGGLTADAEGGLWIATGLDDLRHLDPAAQSWTILRATDLGFAPPEEEGYQGHFLSDLALDANGDLWVADCIGRGEILEGQGLRRFDGTAWRAGGDLDGQCVYAVEADAEGRIWAGGFDALSRYDPAAGSWTLVPLPPWERRQLVSGLLIDPSGNPWVEVMRYGGASPMGSMVRYHLEEGAWVTDVEEAWFSRLAFASDGTAWLCAEGTIFHAAGGTIAEIAHLAEGGACDVAVDGAGRVWALGGQGLWRLDTP